MRAVSISMVVCYLYMQTCNIIVTDSPRRLVISAYYTYVIIIVVVSVAVFVIVLVYALTFIIRYMYLYYCHHAKQPYVPFTRICSRFHMHVYQPTADVRVQSPQCGRVNQCHQCHTGKGSLKRTFRGCCGKSEWTS